MRTPIQLLAPSINGAASAAARSNPAYEKARIAEPKQSRAAMTTPRHAVGATTIGDAIYVAGGGAVTGGSVQSSVHEAFTLAVRPRLPPAFVNSPVQAAL
jgi:hypothetical protein